MKSTMNEKAQKRVNEWKSEEERGANQQQNDEWIPDFDELRPRW